MTRLAASRMTAKDSMSRSFRASSTSSPALATRSRNSTVLCCRASSLRAEISGSRALMSGTSVWRALSFFPSPARRTRLNKDMGASVLAVPRLLGRSAGDDVHVVTQVHRHPPVLRDSGANRLGEGVDRREGGADLAQQVVDRHDMRVSGDAVDAEAGLPEEPGDAAPVEVVEVHVHQPRPVAAQQTGHTAPGVDRGEVQDAARLEQ